MVVLVCGDQKQETTEAHAQRLLYIQKGMNIKNGWTLPDDSPYEFKANALIKRANTGDCKRPSERKGSHGGGVSPKPPEVPHGDGPEQE